MTLQRWTTLTIFVLGASGCDDDDEVRLAGGAGGMAGSAGQSGMSGGGMAGSGMGGSAGNGQGGLDGGTAPDSVTLALVASGLVSPVVLRAVPGESSRLLVADRVGTVRVIDDGQLLPEPVLDIGDRILPLQEGYDERGLLGLALHPDYASNGRVFVFYSAPLRGGAPAGFSHTNVLSEVRLESVGAGDAGAGDAGSALDAGAADGGTGASSERVILQIDQPQVNHNGGPIAFGPDGYLYIPVGDGGGADDVGVGHVEDWYTVNEGGNGQDRTSNVHGSILRIDVDGAEPYAIPATNPFATSEVPEVWAYGFRNPFQIAFDRGGERELFVGDVGQNLWEEVDIVTAGGNYGWNVKEGTHCFSTANPDESLDECPDADPDGVPLTDPIIEYASANQTDGLGLAVIGGHVYRGAALPALEGRYVFGDWSTSFGSADGHLFVASPASGSSWSMTPLAIDGRTGGDLGEYVLGFGEDAAGELYVLTSEESGPSGTSGKVYQIVP